MHFLAGHDLLLHSSNYNRQILQKAKLRNTNDTPLDNSTSVNKEKKEHTDDIHKPQKRSSHIEKKQQPQPTDVQKPQKHSSSSNREPQTLPTLIYNPTSQTLHITSPVTDVQQPQKHTSSHKKNKKQSLLYKHKL